MKVTVEIDCTPEEARAFLGLPDVKPMQEQLLQDVQDRLSANMQAMDPQEIMRAWFSPKAFEQMFDTFNRMSGAARRE